MSSLWSSYYGFRGMVAAALLFALSIAGLSHAAPTGTGSARLPFRATTASFNNGGSNIAGNSCVSQSATTLTGAAPGMVCAVSPAADPGSSFIWECFAGTNIATLRLCNITITAATPGASTYNLEVVP